MTARKLTHWRSTGISSYGNATQTPVQSGVRGAKNLKSLLSRIWESIGYKTTRQSDKVAERVICLDVAMMRNPALTEADIKSIQDKSKKAIDREIDEDDPRFKKLEF